ncbi:MAG: hypothetical protein JST42_30130 [Bacteroidetes bacterium]|nr:hypothetical protein [Bacteroidota bacterium]
MNLSFNKTDYGWLLVICASIGLSLLYIPTYNILCGDKEVYRYVGRVILEGGVPYRDVFDHKPPLIFLLNYAAILLGGDWGQWVMDTVLAVLATGLFYRLCKTYSLRWPWLLPLLFNLMIRDYLICLGMGMTREYTTIFFLIFFCVLMGQHRHRYYLLGLLAGLIFFMQQDQVMGLLPLIVYSLLIKEYASPVGARIQRMAAGFVTVAAPILFYFAWHRALVPFWQDAFLFNLGWYTTTLKESFGDHLRKMKLVLDEGWYEVPFMVAITLGGCSLFFQNRNKRLLIACMTAVALSVLPEFLGGRDVVSNASKMTFTHYYLPLSASLNILLFCVFAFAEEPFLKEWKAQAVFGALVLTSLSYTVIRYGAHLPRLENEDVVRRPELGYLRQRSPANYQLFVFRNTEMVYYYNSLGIIGPSKWVYQHFYFLYDGWDRDHRILQSIQQDLLRHKTTYLLDFDNAAQQFRDPATVALWRKFVVEHYQRVIIPGYSESILWKIKD